MALLRWNDSMSVNITEIDQQHQKLIGMINHLNDAMKAGKGKDVTAKIVGGLMTYTKVHFNTEEKLFDQHGYPETAAHKREHAIFVQKVGNFKRDFDADKIGLSVEIMNFLSNWLTKHIMKTDQQYSAFLNAKGVQ
jgi:hemerythrin